MNDADNSTSNDLITTDQLATAAWVKVLQGVRDLESVYDAYPEMNDTQPAIAEHCIPMSLDEWAAEIEELIDQLKARG